MHLNSTEKTCIRVTNLKAQAWPDESVDQSILQRMKLGEKNPRHSSSNFIS